MVDSLNSWTSRVVISPDGKIIASNFGDETINFFNLFTGEPIRNIKYINNMKGIIFTPDGKNLINVANNKSIIIYRLNSYTFDTLSGHTNFVNSLAISFDGKILASGSSDYTIKLWDLNKRKCTDTLMDHTSIVYAVSFSPDGKMLASGSGDQTAKMSNKTSKIKGKIPSTIYGYSDNLCLILIFSNLG